MVYFFNITQRDKFSCPEIPVNVIHLGQGDFLRRGQVPIWREIRENLYLVITLYGFFSGARSIWKIDQPPLSEALERGKTSKFHFLLLVRFIKKL